MRILSVRLSYAYSDGDKSIEQVTNDRRERLSKLGFDTSSLSDDEMRNAPSFGMNDEQFVELSIAGENDMKINASVTVD